MKILKSKTFAIRAIATLVFALTLGACSENENEMPDTTSGKEKMTFTAGLPGAETRLLHEKNGNAGVKVSWTKLDALMLFDVDGYNTPITYTVVDGSITNGGKTATFEGDDIGMNSYYVYGPAQGDKIPDDKGAGFLFSFLGQVQSENDNLNHLAAYDLISAEITNGNVDNLKFTHQVSIFQFNLTGLPAGTYNKFTIKSSVSDGILKGIRPTGGTSYAQEFPVGLSDIALDGSKALTVWVMLPVTGTNAVFKAGTLTLEVATDSKTYINQTAIELTSDLMYEQGKRYSMTTAMQEVMPQVVSMQFTVKPTDTKSEFTIPFYSTTGSYELMVNWGYDNKTTTIPAGTVKTSDLLKHDYPNDGRSFQITITTNAPSTGEQMPRWHFNNSASAPMLVSMDSPMLNTAATDFRYCFSGCANLVTIFEGLFTSNTSVTSFSYCFPECTSLTAIPDELFANNTAVTNFDHCFRGCTGLTVIPAGLFASNTAATRFNFCFSGCTGLTAIPEGLFATNTVAINFSNCFRGCTGFTEIPEGLFASNTAVTDFSGCFRGCTGLTAIPTGLFAANTAVTKFNYCFNECIGLTAIPAGLFDSNTAVTNFSSCFYDCTGFTAIPAGLFASNTAVTDFSDCFRGCTGLTAIPAGLFASNTAVTNFSDCFRGCTNLTAIPAGLFASNTAATNFSSCFSSCSKAVLNSNIFCNEANDKATRFVNQTINFSYCFNYVGTSLGTGQGGTAPALWEYEYENGTGNTTSTSCFTGCTNVTNYSDIQAATGWY